MEIAHDLSSVAQSVTACSMRMGGGGGSSGTGSKSPRSNVMQRLISPRVTTPPPDDGRLASGGLSDLASVRVRIRRIRGAEVFFEDGTSLKPDLIIWCTGFIYSLPFCTPDLVRVVSASGEDAPNMIGPRIELYQHMWPMQGDTLAFLGMPTVNGSLHPLVDLQSRLFAAVVNKRCELPKFMERERWRTAKRAQWATNAESANYRPLQIEAKAYANEMLGLMGLVDEEWVDAKPTSRSRSNSSNAVPSASSIGSVGSAPLSLASTAATRLAAAAQQSRSSHRVTAVESSSDEDESEEVEEEEEGSSDDVLLVSRPLHDEELPVRVGAANAPAPSSAVPVAVAGSGGGTGSSTGTSHSGSRDASTSVSPRTSAAAAAATASAAGRGKRPTLTKNEGRPAGLANAAATPSGSGTSSVAHASPNGSGALPSLGSSSSLLSGVSKVPLAQEPHSIEPHQAAFAREQSQKQLQPLAKRTPTKEAETSSTKLIGTIRSLVGGRATAWDAEDVRVHRALWQRHVAPLMVPCPLSAACGAQGKRDTMEDTHVLLDRIPGVPEHVASGLWAVFDGHGGAEVARMAEKTLHVRFQKMLVQALMLEGKPVEEIDVERMLRKCFKETDKAINEKLRETDSQNVVRGEREIERQVCVCVSCFC